jgi:hypothetical protein
VNADGQTRTRGTELIARYHREGFDIIDRALATTDRAVT